MRVAPCTIHGSSVVEQKIQRSQTSFLGTLRDRPMLYLIPISMHQFQVLSELIVVVAHADRACLSTTASPLHYLESGQGLDLVRCTEDDTTTSHW